MEKNLVLILKIVPSTNFCSRDSVYFNWEKVIKVHILIIVEVTVVHVNHYFKVKWKQIFQNNNFF